MTGCGVYAPPNYGDVMLMDHRSLGNVARSLRILAGIVGLSLFYGRSLALISESEPNNDFGTADSIACRDTVVCAALPGSDADYFRFHVYYGDSIILTTFACNGSATNTLLTLYDDRLLQVAADDDGGPLQFSRIRYLSVRAGDYFARVVRHVSSSDSSYNLMLECPLHAGGGMDTCGGARIIPALPYYDEGTTLGMTHQCGTAAPDVFYRFSNPTAANVFITLCSDFFDSRVQLLGRCCGDFLDDANTGCNRGAELIVFNLQPGEYFLLVEGTAANQAGDFSLEVTAQFPGCPPPAPLVLGSSGGFPLLDWPQQTGPSYYVVWRANAVDGPFEHLGTTTQTFFIDSTGFTGTRRFYEVTAYCPW